VALATAVVVPFAALPAAAAASHTPASSATSLSALGLTAEQVAAASVEGAATLRSAQLDVQVAADFPRVLSYTDRASGASLAGSTATVTKVRINGTDRAGVVEAGEPRETSRDYRLTFPTSRASASTRASRSRAAP
jgi:endo-alpha-N-acetylgalactosaminidase